MSFRGTTTVPGVGTVRDEDIVSYDESAGTWAWEFDGSDLGLDSMKIDGLAVLPDGGIISASELLKGDAYPRSWRGDADGRRRTGTSK